MMTDSATPPDSAQEFDLAPSPRVLPMLGEINLEQWRCVGELVDNSIDGFLHADRRGERVMDPVVHVTLPEADREDAVVQVVDNGPGMTPDNLAKAVKAGWSGNNPTDNLGLFGMGFNIATARFGLTTEVWTTRPGDTEWHGLEIDFDRLQRQGNFRTPHLTSPKSDTSLHGTKIVVKRLKPAQRQWLARSANQGVLRRRLAQAYAAMLRPNGYPIEFKLYLNNKIVKSRPFCLWNDTRSAELPDLGEVFAVLPFSYPLSDRYHCVACMNWMPISATSDPKICPVCEGAGTLQKRPRRVHGWIGLQRYADTVDFGLDFIRNGRKIEMGSKDLFIWRGENGDEPEYPIDDPSRRGRIVGEIHVDHCRVNFAKERFDRSDPAWEEMLTLIRGEGPLRPEKARELGYSQNESPLFRLYKAFRRMRPHSSVAGGWRRLLSVPDNAIAKELAQKFFDGHPDYQDDTHWWRLIEEAERRLLTSDTNDDEEDTPDDDLPPGLIDGPLGGVSEPDAPAPQPEPIDYRAQRREASSLSRSYVYAPAGQTFTVKAFECTVHDPDLPAAAAWSLMLGDVATRTYHFLFKPRAEVFRSITLEPLDALLIELAFLTNEYLRANRQPPSYAELLGYLREQYARTSSLDARGVAAEASDALATFAQSILANVPPNEGGMLFDALTVEQRSEVMRTLARKGIAPVGPIADGSFITAAPKSVLGRLVEAFPELVFDGKYWDLPYSSLDYGDPQLTDRARQQLIARATSLISDAAWLAEADAATLNAIRKEELVRGLMSVSLIRPDREIL